MASIVLLMGCGLSEKEAKNKIKQYVEDEDIAGFRKVLRKYPGLKKEKFGGGMRSLLQIAADNNYKTDIIKDLLKAGVDVNAVDLGGDTTLHTVCRTTSGKINIIKLLLENGAKVNIISNFNQTPLDCAYKSIKSFDSHLDRPKLQTYPIPSKGEQKFWRKRQNDIIALLRSHGAKTCAELNVEKEAKKNDVDTKK